MALLSNAAGVRPPSYTGFRGSSSDPPLSSFYAVPTPPGSSLPTDVAALHSIINTLQAELKATASVNTQLAASVARLQAEQAAPAHTPTTSIPNTPTPISTTTATAAAPNPTGTTLTAEVLEQLADLFAHRVKTGQAPQIPSTATSIPQAPAPCLSPSHTAQVPDGRGAGSPEIFRQMSETNWNGCLGRAHMADVDALPVSARMELDRILRQRLRAIFPLGASNMDLKTIVDEVFASLGALGLRLDNTSGTYFDTPVVNDWDMRDHGTAKRVRNLSSWYYANLAFLHNGYWRGALLETLSELARYRGLFDTEGHLKGE